MTLFCKFRLKCCSTQINKITTAASIFIRSDGFKKFSTLKSLSKSNLIITSNHVTQKRYSGSAEALLTEVGKLEPIKVTGSYETGQMFLHKIFGYKGIILFPWMARVYDHDICYKRTSDSKDDSDENTTSKSSSGKLIKGKMHSYYQVLIDSRDFPYISQRVHPETVFVDNQSDTSYKPYTISGLDHVSHTDILPYTTSEATPIQHEQLELFLNPQEGASDNSLVGSPNLLTWKEKLYPCLESSDVQVKTTENIRISVIPFYIGCRMHQNNNIYYWRYRIRLENLGDEKIQLRERNWKIFSYGGTLETVRGRGVDGEEPVLSKEQPAFQYSSHVSLQAHSGHMWGSYKMEREDGHVFECQIPPFSLESKKEDSK